MAETDMWWLKAELWVQILDGMAFLFITPEFLSEATLDYLRPKIVDRTDGKFLVAILLVAYAALNAAGLNWVVRHFYVSHISVGELFHSGISGIGALIGYYLMASFLLIQCIYSIVIVVLALARRVAYRRWMLIAGTTFFFLARVLAGWNAVQHGE
jgi:hypothetical protein